MDVCGDFHCKYCFVFYFIFIFFLFQFWIILGVLEFLSNFPLLPNTCRAISSSVITCLKEVFLFLFVWQFIFDNRMLVDKCGEK